MHVQWMRLKGKYADRALRRVFTWYSHTLRDGRNGYLAIARRERNNERISDSESTVCLVT